MMVPVFCLENNAQRFVPDRTLQAQLPDTSNGSGEAQCMACAREPRSRYECGMSSEADQPDYRQMQKDGGCFLHVVKTSPDCRQMQKRTADFSHHVVKKNIAALLILFLPRGEK